MPIFAVLAAAAALSTAPAVARDPPPMYLNAVPLDFADPAHVEVFVARTVEESRAYCARHHAAVTPGAADSPAACERIMGDRAARALPWAARRAFVRAGGLQALHRRQR